MRFDHLILAVPDLPAAAAALAEDTGLVALPGGAHPDWGTINMIVPLGGAYLELVAVADPARAEGSAFGRMVAGADPMALVGWAVEPDDLDVTARRLGLGQQRGRRERADGSTLSWAMAGVEEALSRGLPFFLRWDDAAANPARAAAPHRVEPIGVAWVESATDRGALDAWLGADHGLGVRAATAAPPRAAIALRDGGEIVI